MTPQELMLLIPQADEFNCLEELKTRISTKQAKIGVIGLGYVGLPLVVTFAQKEFPVLGFDVDERKISQIKQAQSYIRHIPSESLNNEFINVTSEMNRLVEADVIIICVPTPLNLHREPDLSYVVETANAIALSTLAA